MNRREFIKLISLSSCAAALSGCELLKYRRIDPWHYLVRSDLILTPEQESEILSKAHLSRTDDGRIRVLVLRGTPYERGYQQGVLLRTEVQENLGYMYEQAVEKFHFAELFAEVYERIRPFIPQEYIDEMHGLAHGARMPLNVVHHIHALPSLAEWGGKKRVKGIIKQMMEGELGTSCSNLSLGRATTADGEFYVVRILDWGLHRISKLHQYPLITVNVPDAGIASANIGWVGFLGAVSGMNAQGITLGEMGYGDPENETLRGVPMPFLLRDVMTYASSLTDVRRIIGQSVGENSYAFLMSDGKTEEAQLYIKDRERFLVFEAGQDAEDREERLPGISDISYGGHYNEKMTELLRAGRGRFSLEKLQNELIPEIAMKSNFQNVIYKPSALQFWVSNARSRDEWAASQDYTFFDLRRWL